VHREAVLAVLAELGVSVDGRPVTTRIDLHRLPARAREMVGAGDVLWLSDGVRLVARDDHNGHARAGAVRVARGERLLGDGRTAWVATDDQGRLQPLDARSGLRRGEAASTGERVVMRAVDEGGRYAWQLTGCLPEPRSCPTGQRLTRPAGGEGAAPVRLRAGVVTGMAVGQRFLWLIARDPAGRGRVERRDRRSGRLLRVTPLARPATSVAVGPRGAWVVDRRGALVRVSVGGRARAVSEGIATVAARGGQLWAMRADRRGIVRVDPGTGRVRAEATSPVPLAVPLAITARHVWALSHSGRALVRVAR
ncbi:MAG TPA: hypothetical protein PKE32_03115, partial [Miltoncostaeaceae bacterium]|nr:hypothetical protein [Miltoncostaeaceae bacterium]